MTTWTVWDIENRWLRALATWLLLPLWGAGILLIATLTAMTELVAHGWEAAKLDAYLSWELIDWGDLRDALMARK